MERPARTAVPAGNGNPPGSGTGELAGLRKAAVLILALEESVASELLQTLSDGELEAITAEIARLGVVDQDTLSTVLQEFDDLSQLHGVLKEGGLDQAIRLVERSFPPERSRRLVQLLESNKPHLPLAFLARAQTESLLVFLEAEHPQTVAVVLAHMTASKAAEVLERMPEEKRRDLVQRIASLQGTHDEVLERLEASLRQYVDTAELHTAPGQRGGAQTAADILRASGRSGRDLLNELRGESPDLVEDIWRRLFLFDDLIRLDDRSVQRLLKEVDRHRLAMALKTSSKQLREKIFANLSQRAKEMVLEEMELLGPVRVGDVEAARRDIVETVLGLEESGAIYVEGRGAREDRLVY